MKYLTHSVLFGPAVLLFFAIVGIYIWKTYQMADGFSDPLFFSVIRETVLIFLLCFYVIRLGGDFMAFRFMLPVVTILALFSMRYLKLIFDEGWLGSKTEKVLIQFGFVTAFALLWIPVPISKGYIADERAHFVKDFKPEASLFSKFLSYFDAASHPWGKAGAEMKELQSCLSYDPFIVANSQAEARCRSGMGLGYSGYAAGPEVNIIDEQGISDFYVARLPVPVRFRPGHEHSIGTYEILEKKVLFCHTGDAFYDEVMSTPYGVLVRLDEQLIATLPDARDRLQKLMVLKQKRSAGLEMVEHFSETSVENLLQKSNRWNQNWNFISRHDCWNSKK